MLMAKMANTEVIWFVHIYLTSGIVSTYNQYCGDLVCLYLSN